MIIIPEIETVILLVPKTGTSSIIKAVKERYPNSFQLYRHMEADGVPYGYDRWRRYGVVRKPLDRLWSLYKYCKTVSRPGFAEYQDKLRNSVDKSFDNWLLTNEIIFTDPNSSRKPLEYFPRYAIKHAIPENRKSQWIYLRPDLGTKIIRYDRLTELEDTLNISLPRLNETYDEEIPRISVEAHHHICKYHMWDLKVTTEKLNA